MISPIPNLKTVSECIELLNFITERTENVEAPMSILSLAREFKEKSGVAETVGCLEYRIRFVRTKIQSFEHMDTNTKVRMMFALSASVNTDFLKKLKKNALVEIDDEQRIAHYKANDGSLELGGDHSRSTKNRNAQLNLKRGHRNFPVRKLIRYYFENKNNADAIPINKEERERWNLIEFITEKCDNINSPLNITRVAKDFTQHFGIPVRAEAIRKRIRTYRLEIQKAEFLDTQTSVKQLFGLSVTVNSDYLEKLRKDAHVEVDEENRISYYKANNGDLELKGNHSQFAKLKTTLLEAEWSHRKFIRDYFENKKNASTVPKNEEEREMWNLIEFITENCDNVNSPLTIRHLTKDFNNHFGSSRSFDCIHRRIRRYCCEIQTLEFSDTHSKVRQLFALSATLDSNFLKELRKDAVVEVDDLNRITKYTANNGGFTLHGDHSRSAKRKSDWIERKKKRNAVEIYCNSAGDEDKEEENRFSEDAYEEFSSEEFGNEFDLDNDNYHLDETENLMEQPVRNRSELSIDNSFDFDPPTKRSHRSEEIKTRETVEENNDSMITGNAVIKTRSGRLSKRRHLDSNFSYDLANYSNSKPAKHFHHQTERSHESKGIAMREDDGRNGSSNWTGESSNNSRRLNEQDGYDTNYSIDDQVKLEPFRGSIQEDFDEFEEDEDIQQIPKPPQAHDEHNLIEEVSIKEEPDEPKTVENPTEDVKPELTQGHDEHKERIEVPIKMEHQEPVDVKPETYHNSKIKFFEAIQSLILCLDTPSLSEIQSRIHQMIQKLEKSDEVILNNKIVLIIDLLISRIIDHSIVNSSNDAESVNFSNFLCYLKAAILNSKLSGVECLVKHISKLIEDSQNKSILIEKVANALRATLDID